MKLTPKQQAFADYYIETGNATESAIKAGYSKKTATVIGAENLTKPNIRFYIEKHMNELSNKRIADAEEVLQFLTSIIRDEVEEEIVIVEGAGDGISEAKTVNKKLAAKDKIKAAELIGKRFGIWTEKREVDVTAVVFRGEEDLED